MGDESLYVSQPNYVLDQSTSKKITNDTSNCKICPVILNMEMEF